jgi:predicted nucleotidyltransferase
MRITDEKIKLLKSTILSILPDAKVYLFGSRVDDNKKGGDIDILIIADRTLDFIEEGKIERQFFKHFGAQKLDLVSFKKSDKAPFKAVALMNAIQL